MRKIAWVAPVVLALAGCSGGGTDMEGGQQAIDAEASANADENFTEKQESSESAPADDSAGELGVTYDGVDQITDGTYTYVIHSITVDPQCQDPEATPEEGHFVELKVTMTANEINPESPWVDFSAMQEMALTDPSGKLDKTPFTYESWLCEGNEGDPGSLDEGQSADFVVVLDTSYTSGIITYLDKKFTY